MTAADCWADRDALREGIARIYDPTGWTVVDSARASSQPAIAERWAAMSLAKADSILKLIEAARHSQPGAEGGWQPIETHDGSDESVLAICATAYTPTAFEAWFFDGAWRLCSRGGEKQSSGVTKWFPTHWMPKPAPPQQPATSTDEKVGR